MYESRPASLSLVSTLTGWTCIVWYKLLNDKASRPENKSSIDSLSCSSPRKSLVKGERFMRSEEKPELTKAPPSVGRIYHADANGAIRPPVLDRVHIRRSFRSGLAALEGDGSTLLAGNILEKHFKWCDVYNRPPRQSSQVVGRWLSKKTSLTAAQTTELGVKPRDKVDLL